MARARAGHSTALNLAEVDYKQVHRGMVVGEPGSLAGSTLLGARLALLPSARGPLAHMAAVRVHLGTAEVLGRLALLEGTPLVPGAQALVQLRLGEPVVAAPGDRFIVRDASASRTLGGGTVIALLERRLKPGRVRVLQGLAKLERALGEPRALLAETVRQSELVPLALERLRQRTGLGRVLTERLAGELTAAGELVALRHGAALVHREALAAASRRLVERLGELFGERPLLPEIELRELRAAAGLDEALFERALEAALQAGTIERGTAGGLALPGRQVALEPRQQALAERLARAVSPGRRAAARQRGTGGGGAR
ncbi:MAG: hypothetical protein KatS3mg102_1263 [Planctomycetota bacterium]|nr:MAG: hypothetical protein KatS3mg102_1263 [Planctomycetota bacterium]